MIRKFTWPISLFCLACLLLVLPPGGVSAWAWEYHIRWLYVTGISFFAVVTLIPWSMKVAEQLDAIDRPDPRKIHTLPTPRLGGLAVFGALGFTILRTQLYGMRLYGLFLGAAIIFVLGFVEDCWALPARTRLFWQVIAAVITAESGLILNFPKHWLAGQVLAPAITVVWVVGLINAFNFLDGIDGLAAGLGTICSLFMLGLAWDTQQQTLAFLAAAMTGACFGFLNINWHPARVFLGDCGSTLIGFMLAELAVMGGWSSRSTAVSLCTPLLILGVPIFDIIYITISRIRRGVARDVRQWLEYVDKDHFHHRLMDLGMTVEETVGFILLVNVCLGLDAWAMHATNSDACVALLLTQALAVLGVVVILMLKSRGGAASRRIP